MGPTPKYHPGIDGLRGVAVVMVLLFHSGLGWLKGGFLGVSIFFTLSGYLITTLLLVEVEEKNRISFSSFWARRLRRLLPASLVAIGAVVLFAPLLSTAVEESRIRGDAVSAVLYLSNWRYVQAGMSYEELFSSKSPLLHLWSLSIEAQMYIVVPLLVIVGAALGLRRRGLAVLMTLGVIASVMISVFSVEGDRLYYGTDSRAAELLMGALLACMWPATQWRSTQQDSTNGTEMRSRYRSVSSCFPLVVFIGVIAISLFTTTGSPWVYSGALGGFSILSAALVYGSIQPGLLRRFLSLGPLVIIGRVSYGLYLYHWPIFVWLTPERTDLDGVTLFVVRLLATSLVTAVSYVALESPIRRRRFLTSPGSTRSVTAVAFVVSLLGPLVFLSPYRAVVEINQEVLTTVAPMTTTPGDIGGENQKQPLRVVVLGDSTAENVARAFADAADPNLGVISAGVIGCPLLPATRVYDRPGATQDATYCPDNLDVLRQYVFDVDAVVIVGGVANQWDFEPRDSSTIIEVGSISYRSAFVQWMQEAQTILAEVGVPMIIFDAPMTRQSDTVLGDESSAVTAWNEVIAEFDRSWESVRLLPFSQFLSDPNSDAGRLERPDGVHLDRNIASALARQSLIPLLREIYRDVVMQMIDTKCRFLGSNQKWQLDTTLCRTGTTSP